MTRRQPIRVYSWASKGNLGDDWLAEVADQFFRTKKVSEHRCLRPFCAGRYCLTGAHEATHDALLLWGGGWLAEDRPGSTTLARWVRHARRQKSPMFTFGLGLGPFADEPRVRQRLELIRGNLVKPVSVRCAADLVSLEPGTGVVDCDPSLLDPRFQEFGHARQLDRLDTWVPERYVVLSMPRFSSHWATMRPWMTESWYRDWVSDAVDKLAENLPVVFLETDSGQGDQGDAVYWRHISDHAFRPQSVMSAASVLAGATLHVSGRLHAGIMGALVGTPGVNLAYHHKFRVLEELGCVVAGLDDEPPKDRSIGLVDEQRLFEVRRRGHAGIARLKHGLDEAVLV